MSDKKPEKKPEPKSVDRSGPRGTPAVERDALERKAKHVHRAKLVADAKAAEGSADKARSDGMAELAKMFKAGKAPNPGDYSDATCRSLANCLSYMATKKRPKTVAALEVEMTRKGVGISPKELMLFG